MDNSFNYCNLSVKYEIPSEHIKNRPENSIRNIVFFNTASCMYICMYVCMYVPSPGGGAMIL